MEFEYYMGGRLIFCLSLGLSIPKLLNNRNKIGTNFMIDICLRLLYFDTEQFYCLAGRFLFDIENYQDDVIRKTVSC